MAQIGATDIYEIPFIKPVVFLHVEGYEAMTKYSSFENQEEKDVILHFFGYVKSAVSTFDPKRIGVISPYSAQVSLIKHALKTEYGQASSMEVSTVDGFQGREKDVIIFSTVRSARKGGGDQKTIGFLDDRRRMNVSLSRAKQLVLVVGNAKKLKISKRWKNMVNFAISHQSCYKVTEPYEQYFTSLAEDPKKYLIEKI